MAHTERLPLPVVEEWEWQRHAACRGMDVTAFFHPSGERGAQAAQREAEAKQVCSRCPVQAECLAYSLAIEEPYGTWGGVGERERREIVSRHRAVRREQTESSEGTGRPSRRNGWHGNTA